MTARLSDQTLLDRLQQLSSSTPRSVPLPVTGTLVKPSLFGNRQMTGTC